MAVVSKSLSPINWLASSLHHPMNFSFCKKVLRVHPTTFSSLTSKSYMKEYMLDAKIIFFFQIKK